MLFVDLKKENGYWKYGALGYASFGSMEITGNPNTDFKINAIRSKFEKEGIVTYILLSVY